MNSSDSFLLSVLLSVRYIVIYKELITCHVYVNRTTYTVSLAPVPYENLMCCIKRTIQSELNFGSVLELKGLHQWTYPYSKLLSSHWLH